MLSFIFCYRNREQHLNLTIPRVRMLYPTSEIIVVEQADHTPFVRGNLLNIGTNYANGDIVVLHDIDYYPTHDTVYHDGVSDVFLPAKSVQFVYNDLTPKPLHEVPGGYRNFINTVGDHWGGVSSFKIEAFQKINGFDSGMRGWGKEDESLRERIKHYGLSVARGNSKFLALDHIDSGAVEAPHNLQMNTGRLYYWKENLSSGLSTELATHYPVRPKHPDVDRWVEAMDFDDGPTNIISSNF